MVTPVDAYEGLVFKGFDSSNEGVQTVVQGLALFMIHTGQGPRLKRAPSLADHAKFWRKDRSTISRWLQAAVDEGAITRHDDGTLELVLADDSEPYRG